MKSTALLFTVLALVGCVPADHIEVDNHAVYADSRPPEPRDELDEMGAPPGEAYVWVGGYWWWTGSGWVWVGGRWATPPQGGHVYISPGWIVVQGRYRYIPGRWAHRGYVPRYRYVYPRRHYPYRYPPPRRR